MSHRRRSRCQRLLLEVAAIVLVVLLGSGLRWLWDEIYLPSRPVAQVGDQTVSTRHFRQLQELQITYSAIRARLESEDAGEHQASHETADSTKADEASTELARQVAADLHALQNAPLDYTLIDHWILEETLLQGAARDQQGVDEPAVLAALAEALQAGGHAHAEDHGQSQGQDRPVDLRDKPGAPPDVPPEQAQQFIDSTLRIHLMELTDMLKQVHPGLALNVSQVDLRAYALRLQRLELLRDQIAASLVPMTAAPQMPHVQAQSVFLSIPSALSSDPQRREPALERRKAEADEVYAKLAAGAEMREVAQEYALDDHGVTPYWTIAEKLLPGAREALQTLPIGEISQPIKTDAGWGIYKVLDRARRPDEQQLRQMREEALQSWLDRQQVALGVTRFVERPPEGPGPHDDLGPDHRQPAPQGTNYQPTERPLPELHRSSG